MATFTLHHTYLGIEIVLSVHRYIYIYYVYGKLYIGSGRVICTPKTSLCTHCHEHAYIYGIWSVCVCMCACMYVYIYIYYTYIIIFVLSIYPSIRSEWNSVLACEVIELMSVVPSFLDSISTDEGRVQTQIKL